MPSVGLPIDEVSHGIIDAPGPDAEDTQTVKRQDVALQGKAGDIVDEQRATGVDKECSLTKEGGGHIAFTPIP